MHSLPSTRNGAPRLTGITTKSRALPNRLLLHAVQKWGKTSFAAHAPKPIFICTRGEDGLDTLIKSGEVGETAHFEDTVKTYRHLLMAIDELLVHPHDYKTLVIDTINGAERLMVEQIIDEHFEGKRESFDAYARGYKFIPDEVHKLLDQLEKLRELKNMSIILLAHSQVKTFQNPEGPNYDRWEPVLQKETWAIIDRWVDMILFGSYETFTEKANKKDVKAKATGGQERIIHTERHAAFDAGNRYGLPAEIECGDSAKEAWDNFMTALHPNRKKE